MHFSGHIQINGHRLTDLQLPSERPVWRETQERARSGDCMRARAGANEIGGVVTFLGMNQPVTRAAIGFKESAMIHLVAV